ncbi:MAG: hypothetical protein WCJ49_00210 [Deltaproteobacteria bacterium]
MLIQKQCRYLLPFIGIILSLNGCLGFSPKQIPTVPCDYSLALRTIKAIKAEHEKQYGIKAIASIVLDNEAIAYKVAIVIVKPDKLRIEVLPPWGTPILLLCVNNGNVSAFVPYANKYYTGKITKALTNDYLPVPVEIAELIDILMGQTIGLSDMTFDGDAYTCNNERNYYQISTKRFGNRYNIWVDANSNRIAKYVREGDDNGKLSVVYSYEPHSHFPSVISMDFDGRTAVVQYVEWENMGNSSNNELFQLLPPQDAQIININ